MLLTFDEFSEKYVSMATTMRHNRLLTGFIKSSAIGEFFIEQIALVYNVSSKPFLFAIADAFKLDLNQLPAVYPDYMLFNNNGFVCNPSDTRIAGSPDLIVEVWSDSNSEYDRDFKKMLYSTGKNTEHWYLTQNANEVECYYENTQLPMQSLKKPLVTQKGLVFDLTRLAL